MATGNVKPFGIKDKLGYLFGDFGNDFTFILSSSFLMKFYTDVMGVPGAAVGVVMMIARFVDAFTDVTMGRICDRSKMTPVGKFKPWIRRMCGPVAIASFLMYQSALADMPMAFKIGYLFVTYILWGSIFYTSVNIPYGSMASAISPEASDRQSLSTFRSIGGTLAGVIIGAGIPLVAYDQVGDVSVLNGGKFTIAAGVCSVLAVICYLLCYSLTTERVKPEKTEEEKQVSVGKMLINAVKNRALISIIVAAILMLLAQLTMQSMANYVYPNFYGNAKASSAATMVMMVAMFIAAALAKPISNKIGKAELSVISSILATVVCIVLFIMRPENVWVYVAMITIAYLGLGMFNMVVWALITDVIDYSEIVNGIREDGSVYALYSFARKLGQAASAGLSGLLLTAVGYTEATAFEDSVVNGIFNISTLVPALGFGLLAVVLWFWYPLHKKQVDANIETLKKKHGDK
ncbi:MAG: MFS transporter [Roseburia sp.]|nr:MFS transporter [Roseburia sp.]